MIGQANVSRQDAETVKVAQKQTEGQKLIS